MTGIRTRAVDRSMFKNYLKKADEHRDAMNTSYDKGDWNACGRERDPLRYKLYRCFNCILPRFQACGGQAIRMFNNSSTDWTSIKRSCDPRANSYLY